MKMEVIVVIVVHLLYYRREDVCFLNSMVMLIVLPAAWAVMHTLGVPNAENEKCAWVVRQRLEPP